MVVCLQCRRGYNSFSHHLLMHPQCAETLERRTQPINDVTRPGDDERNVDATTIPSVDEDDDVEPWGIFEEKSFNNNDIGPDCCYVDNMQDEESIGSKGFQSHPNSAESDEAVEYLREQQDRLDSAMLDEIASLHSDLDGEAFLDNNEEHGGSNVPFNFETIAPTIIPGNVMQQEIDPPSAAIDFVDDSGSCLRQWPSKTSSVNQMSPHRTDPGNIDLKRYNPDLLDDSPYFHFRLALAKMVYDQKPRPPIGFIDKILKLLRRYCAGKNGIDLTQQHMLHDTFIENLRQLTGRTAKPEIVPVSLESGSYGTMDHYDNRNNYRDTATIVKWDAEEQVRSILGNTAIFGKLSNLVVNQTGDPFAKYVPPDGRLGEVLTGAWYDRAYANMIARHESRDDLDEKMPPFLMSTMLSMDATGIDANNRFKSEPLMMTFANIKAEIRNKTELSWRPLGLMPPLDHKSKNARLREQMGDLVSKLVKYGLNARNIHCLLGRILESFLDLQKNGLVVELQLGEHKKVVHCYFPLSECLGDGKQQDSMGGRISSHYKGCPRLCYQCHCVFVEIDDEKHECQSFLQEEYVSMTKHCQDITVCDVAKRKFYGGTATDQMKTEFLRREEEETLGDIIDLDASPWSPEPIMRLERFEEYINNIKSKAVYRVDSVMNAIDYGGSPRGQFGALTIDTLHALLGGMIKQGCGCFIRGLPSITKELFEKIADRIHQGQKSTEDRYLPRTNFTHGCTNLTQLTCREWAGLMLTILVVCKTYTGQAILERLAHRTNRDIAKSQRTRQEADTTPVTSDIVSDCGSDDEMLTGTNRNKANRGEVSDGVSPDDLVTGSDFVHVAEMMLSFYGYMNRRVFWKKGDTESARYFQQSCDILLLALKEKLPRNVGNNWRLSKVHLMLKRSLPHILEFGSPRHSNCEIVERMLRFTAKAPSGNTNRQNYDSVTKTAANNLDVSYLLHEADAILYSENTSSATATFDFDYESIQSPTSRTFYVPRQPEWRPDSEEADSKGGVFVGGPEYWLGYRRIIDPTTQQVRWMYQGKWQRSRASGHREVPQMIMDHMFGKFFQNKKRVDCPTIECYTEIFLATGKRIRCHPNFRSKDLQFDWVLLRVDPFQGLNCLFQGYNKSHNIPVPACWADVVCVNDDGEEMEWEDGDPVYPPTTQDLLRRVGQSLGIAACEGSITNDSVYFSKAWTPIKAGLKKMLNLRTSNDLHREAESIGRISDTPGHYFIADLPQPSKPECLVEEQQRFGEKVVPAKVLCLFKDPSTGRAKALVHPCSHRTLENFIQSSSLISNWSLQYMYEDRDADGVEDVVSAQTAIVDVTDDIIDRIAAKQEFPGYNNYLNPSSWRVKSEEYGLKPPRSAKSVGDGNLSYISTNHPLNRINRRRAIDAHRNVLVITPMEYWGNEFTTEASIPSNRQKRKRKRKGKARSR